MKFIFFNFFKPMFDGSEKIVKIAHLYCTISSGSWQGERENIFTPTT